jgi:hypothetical protein
MMPTVEGVDLAAVLNHRADELRAACDGISDDDAALRPSKDEWSVREHLSHLYGEDRDTFLDGIRRVLVEGVGELEVTPGITHYSVDRRQVPFTQLLEAVCRQYENIAEIAAGLDEREIALRVRIDLLKDSPLTGEPTLGQWVMAIADMHLPAHIAAIAETRR